VDIPASARVVTDPAERRPLMAAAAQRWGRTDVDEMVLHSPLIVVTVADADLSAVSDPSDPKGDSGSPQINVSAGGL
jgi:hypothetical protein